MSWNGHPVIDLDAHIVERADRFYRDYLDPAYHDAYQQLCDAVARQAEAGNTYSLFGSRTSIVEPIETGRPLGRRDTFGLTRRSNMVGGRRAFPPGRVDALPPVRPEVSGDVTARLEDMDRGQVDVNVLYPDTWQRSLEFCVQELGEDLWLFESDWPHGDTAWPESVEQVVKRPGLTEHAKRKILSENALRLCPRLSG